MLQRFTADEDIQNNDCWRWSFFSMEHPAPDHGAYRDDLEVFWADGWLIVHSAGLLCVLSCGMVYEEDGVVVVVCCVFYHVVWYTRKMVWWL